MVGEQNQDSQSHLLPAWADQLPMDWNWHSLHQICDEIIDCPHSTPEVVGHSPYLMARTTDILTGSFRSDEARRVSEATYLERTRRAKPQKGDLLYSREGTYFGFAAEVPANTKICLGQRMVLIRPNSKVVDTTYLRFWLNSPKIQSYIHGHRDGTVAERLNLPTIRQLPICLPVLNQQRTIAEILGALDDKIELNRQMNQTLEAMARAIFKSWFIDFDPVHAKANGNTPYGLDHATAALFPDGFQDSILGPIPKDWKVKSIGEAVRVFGGGTPSTKQPRYWEGGVYPFCTPRDMSKLTSPVLLDTERHLTEAGVEKVSSGLLPVGTVILSSRAPIGYLAITECPVTVNQGIIAMICDEDLPNHYVLHWTRTNMPAIEANANGSTFAEISKRNFRPIPAIVPPRQVLEIFENQVKPLHELMTANIQEANTLAKTRDTLLPKLLSGKLTAQAAKSLTVGVAR